MCAQLRDASSLNKSRVDAGCGNGSGVTKPEPETTQRDGVLTSRKPASRRCLPFSHSKSAGRHEPFSALQAAAYPVAKFSHDTSVILRFHTSAELPRPWRENSRIRRGSFPGLVSKTMQNEVSTHASRSRECLARTFSLLPFSLQVGNSIFRCIFSQHRGRSGTRAAAVVVVDYHTISFGGF